MKKVFALVLALALLMSVTAAFADKTPITLWTIAVESDSNRAAYLAAVDAFNAANPDYEMTMEPTENEAYKTKIKAAMSAGEDLPDIFFTWSMSFLGDFVDAGRVYCLDEELPNYKDKLTDTVLANTTYDGKHYGVPLTMNVVTMFANMDMLKEVGWEKLPETYEELTQLCDALLAAGKIPFGVAGKEKWCISEYFEPIVAKTIGTAELTKIYQGEASWNQEGIVKAANVFRELIEKGYFDPNAAALGNEEVKQGFIDGKYAFYQNGSWNCGDIATKSAFEVEACMFPVIDTEKSSLYQMIGGPNDTLAVTATAVDPALCAKAAFDLGCIVSREGNLNGAGMPTWAVDYDTSNVNKLSVEVGDMVALSDGMVLFGDNILSADAANTYLDILEQLFAGDLDGQGFADSMGAALQ
ncbi:MAG: extracellular solute-binding protein [Clostridia bacterium]|nr:extracellular solute-binding protein [Clostridia bacterium]